MRSSDSRETGGEVQVGGGRDAALAAGVQVEADLERLTCVRGLLRRQDPAPLLAITEQDVDRAITVLNRVFKKTKPPEK